MLYLTVLPDMHLPYFFSKKCKGCAIQSPINTAIPSPRSSFWGSEVL